MKRLLDRLMARQRRLMEALAEPPTPQHRAVTPVPARATPRTEAQLAAEDRAIEQALEALSNGEVNVADALLLPFAAEAGRARTLTTLSRIRSTRGDIEEAVQLLRAAERLDPTDTKTWRLFADLFALAHWPQEEVQYRRKLAFADANVPTQAYLDWLRALLKATPKTATPPINEIELALRKLDGRPDVEAPMRLHMAETLYAFPALTKRARKRYQALSPKQEHEVDTPAAWVRMIEWCRDAQIEATRLTEHGVPAHRPTIAELGEVIVSPSFQWIPIVGGGKAAFREFAFQPITLRSEDPSTPALMNSGFHVELRLLAQPRRIGTPALLLGGTPRYYLNTVGFLASLAVAEESGIGADLPLVVNADLAPFQLEQLAILGIAEERLLRLAPDRPVQFDRLTVPSRLVQAGRWVDPLLPQWYRRRFVAPRLAEQGASRHLYVLPQASEQGRILNQDELVAMLARRGYEAVAPAKLSVREQVELFAQTSHIVGLVNAALTNMVFAPAGAAVVALYNRHLMQGRGDAHFDTLAEACGHRYAAFGCSPARVHSGQRVVDADVLVDLEALGAELDRLDA